MPNLLLQNWVSTLIDCLIKFGFFCRNLFFLQNVFVFEDVSPSGTDKVGDFDDVDFVVDASTLQVSIKTTLTKLGMFGSWSGPRRNRCFSKVFLAYIDVNGEVLEILIAMVGLVVPVAACTTCGRYRSPRWSTKVMRQSDLVLDLLHVLFRWCNLRE